MDNETKEMMRKGLWGLNPRLMMKSIKSKGGFKRRKTKKDINALREQKSRKMWRNLHKAKCRMTRVEDEIIEIDRIRLEKRK